MTDTTKDIDQLCVNTIRMLSIDMVQKANSGHPGTPLGPLGAVPEVYALWQRVLRYDPQDPEWPNRDRFVLSAGHASAMLYSLLHLTEVKATLPSYGDRMGGPAVTLDDLKAFRQIDSRCPGHPEYGWISGVETTTGPLGQGLATSVGMAIAGKWLAARYNTPGFELFDFNVFALSGDGCQMEGVTNEAASIAGHLQLDNLCWIYDRNKVTIEGHIDIAFTEDVGARLTALGWNVLEVKDANDLDAVMQAYQGFLATKGKPTLIIIHSIIGYGSPEQDTREAHGDPLGVENVRKTKQFFGWPPDAQFLVPDGVVAHFQNNLGKRGADAHAAWNVLFAAYRKQYHDLAAEVDAMQSRDLPAGWDKDIPVFPADPKGMASRDASGKVLNALAKNIPWVMGGAADLWPSTRTLLNYADVGDFQGGSYGGRNFHFGIREHAMSSIANGMSVSRLRPYASGFFIFTDYCRGAIRLSSLMETPVLWVWTHDSISVGEDGPTHEPIEQIASFRAMPGIVLFRPADANETAEAYRAAVQMKDRPVMFVLSRQALPTIDRSTFAPASGVAKGAYVLADAPNGQPDVLLLASGSEVSLCLAARDQLTAEGIHARVVSMPSWELFDAQDQAYRESVIPPAVKARVSVEEASTFGWERYAGMSGTILGMHTFGLSAPGKIVQNHFGFTVEHVIAAAKQQVAQVTAAAK